MNMKCTEDKLMNDLVEVYTYHYKRVVGLGRGDSRVCKKIGRVT